MISFRYISNEACSKLFFDLMIDDTILTTEFTLMIRLEEVRISEGKRSNERRDGAKWFTCMCCSYPSFENFCDPEK